jgi:hypothetical protein
VTIKQRLSHVILPRLVQQLLGYSVVYTGPGVPPERSKTTRAHWIRHWEHGPPRLDGVDLLTDDTAARNTAVTTAVGAKRSMTADDLAGRIHGDIQRGFLRAEVIDALTLLEFDTYVAAKESGVVRMEGRDYRLQPNDVVLIKWKS